MENKEIQIDKKYKTVNGEAVRILCVDSEGHPDYPVLAIVGSGVDEKLLRYTKTGSSSTLSNSPTSAWFVNLYYGYGYANGKTDAYYKLIEIPKVIIGWVNVYPYGGMSDVYISKQSADEHASNARIACIQVTFSEGEGL